MFFARVRGRRTPISQRFFRSRVDAKNSSGWRKLGNARLQLLRTGRAKKKSTIERQLPVSLTRSRGIFLGLIKSIVRLKRMTFFSVAGKDLSKQRAINTVDEYH